MNLGFRFPANHDRAALCSVHGVSLAPIVLVLLVACSSGRYSTPSANQQVRQVTDTFVSLAKQEPALPGFKISNMIAANAFAGRARADSDVLLGRMYYDSTGRITAGTATRWPRFGTPTRAAVSAELSSPSDSSRFSRGYFDKLLTDTRDHMSRDGVFKRDIENSTAAALRPWNPAWDDYACELDGEPMPMTFCRMAWIFNWAF